MISAAPSAHPILSLLEEVERGLKDISDVDPVFMSTADKRAALLGWSRVIDRAEELRLRVLAEAEDVAADDGARDAGAWLAHHIRIDPARARWLLRLSQSLRDRTPQLRAALAEGLANLDQTAVIERALRELPDPVDGETRRRAEERLVAEAATFGPKTLRCLGRRVLDVVAPEVGESAEAAALDREEREAARKTYLRFRQNGDGTTDLRGRVPDALATRLQTYLQAFTSPRREPGDAGPVEDRRPYDERLGAAFGSLLEAVDPGRLPLHGGDATTVLVTVTLDDLHAQLAEAGVALVGDEPISAGQVRRLACRAAILPVVLGGDSQVLDLGRSRRLFSPAQRKAMAIRDVTCRAQGCDVPAAWCEAHHAGVPWAAGGRTDVADGVLLCSFHHHRAHDERYELRRTAGGQLVFHRRN